MADSSEISPEFRPKIRDSIRFHFNSGKKVKELNVSVSYDGRLRGSNIWS